MGADLDNTLYKRYKDTCSLLDMHECGQLAPFGMLLAAAVMPGTHWCLRPHCHCEHGLDAPPPPNLDHGGLESTAIAPASALRNAHGMSSSPAPRERVAVVGSGLAGLLTAYLLTHDARERYAVTVLESGAALSLDAASVSLSGQRVDLPMRAFAGGFYRNLQALYDHLGVAYRAQPFLFEFAGSGGAHFVHASNLHQRGARPPAMSTWRYMAEAAYLAASYWWFIACCFLVAPRRAETLQRYLARTRVPRHFTRCYLLPLLSSVATASHDALLRFPAADIVAYKNATHGAAHYTVSEGVCGVQRRLVEHLDIRLNATVLAVTPCDKGVVVSWSQSHTADHGEHTQHFDSVVLAVAPDVVGRIFAPLRHLMPQIPTAVVQSIVHTDRHVLGPAEAYVGNKHGAQLIRLHTSTSGVHKTESHHVQTGGAIVSTCPFSPIDPTHVVGSATFTRVLRSPESRFMVNAMFNHVQTESSGQKPVVSWRNGHDQVWLVGGWCWDGMVLLEGCVVSAMRTANAYGVEIPWQHPRSNI